MSQFKGKVQTMDEKARNQKVISLLSKLVSIPSMNPGDENEDMTLYSEKNMALFLVDYFENSEFPFLIETDEVLPNRPNLIVRTGVDENKKTLLFETHTDTVKVENMVISPFDPYLENGKLYGRGACDAKGQLVAMILGMEAAIEETKGELPINVCFAATVDEEHLHRGVDSFVDQKFKADGTVVGEPTELKLVVATKGSIRFKIITGGKSVHSANTRDGINAIYIMSEIIQTFYKALVPKIEKKNHDYCGSASASITVINGGTQVNIIPDNCVINVDRRLLPGENWEDAYNEIKNTILEVLDPGLHSFVHFESPYLIDPSLETDIKSTFVHAISNEMRKNGVSGGLVGVSFGTDASKIAKLNIPTVVFGPGSIEQAHTKDEFIEIDQIVKAIQIYKSLILNFSNYFEEVEND